ncbi:MAG: cysteine desulfurase NifS [Tissierellia bacterium]|nr:cysteine desulfurase NifS [Tissierellia bacterium]
MGKMIYMDNAATTRVNEDVFEAMIPYYKEEFGNASSIYEIGQNSRKAVENARNSVAKFLGADPKEIYFTSGGTESDNWAIRGIAEALKNKGNHIITSKIEHHAVLHVCEYLEKHGYDVTYLDVDSEGIVDLNQLENAITDKTILITIMFANNEIGTIQPIKKIGEIATKHNVLFHTDAVQAVGAVDINVKEMGIDLLSLSGHKINGPKGIGALYIRRGINIQPFMIGGAQERRKRGGTENVPGIVGLGKAIEIKAAHLEENKAKLSEMRDYLIEQILEKVPYTRLNGATGENRLPGNVNVCFEFIEGESMLLLLNMHGIAGSSGSACTSGSLDPSHVLLAIGLPHEIAHGSLRLSISIDNTKEEIDFVVENLAKIINRLREMSPLYEDFIKGENK